MGEQRNVAVCFTFSITFSILYARRYGIVGLVGSVAAAVVCSRLFAGHNKQLFRGILDVEHTIGFTQTIVYFVAVLCVSSMFLFPQNLSLELRADSTLFYKIAMSLLISAGCIGTNLIIIFVWDVVYRDYLRLADKLQGSSSKFHKKILMVIRPELILFSVVNVLICAIFKIQKEEALIVFYFVVAVVVACILTSHSYSKMKLLPIASTEVMTIQTKSGKGVAVGNVPIYQIGYVLTWKNGSILRHVSINDVQQIEVKGTEGLVSTWKPEYRNNAFQWVRGATKTSKFIYHSSK